MNKVKIAVLVSGGGTNLQALIDAEKNGVLNSGEITLVLSEKADAYALVRAKNAGIECAVVNRKECADRADFENRLIEKLEGAGAELIILAGFMRVLSENFTERYKNRIINVHPSLIPAFCGDGFYGLKVHEAALAYGVKVTGATVHFVNEVTDGGKIIMQKAVEIQEGDTPEILQKRVMEQAEWIILPAAAEKISSEILRTENKKSER